MWAISKRSIGRSGASFWNSAPNVDCKSLVVSLRPWFPGLICSPYSPNLWVCLLGRFFLIWELYLFLVIFDNLRGVWKAGCEVLWPSSYSSLDSEWSSETICPGFLKHSFKLVQITLWSGQVGTESMCWETAGSMLWFEFSLLAGSRNWLSAILVACARDLMARFTFGFSIQKNHVTRWVEGVFQTY